MGSFCGIVVALSKITQRNKSSLIGRPRNTLARLFRALRASVVAVKLVSRVGSHFFTVLGTFANYS